MPVIDFNSWEQGETSRNTKTVLGYGWVDEQQERTQSFSELTFSLESSFSWPATVSKTSTYISQPVDLQIELEVWRNQKWF